jgi:hypothetical protein
MVTVQPAALNWTPDWQTDENKLQRKPHSAYAFGSNPPCGLANSGIRPRPALFLRGNPGFPVKIPGNSQSVNHKPL